jgi:hypothetical protein
MYQGGHKKKSTGTPLMIEPYSHKGPEPKRVGFPMATEVWAEQEVVDEDSGVKTKIRKRIQDESVVYMPEDNCGNFHIEFKGGVVTITIKMKLNVIPKTTAKRKRKIFRYIKKRVERYWNLSHLGFRQWVYHRNDCLRGEKCNCRIIEDSKGKLKQGGCCKVPVRVKLEEGPDNEVDVHLLSLAQIKQKKKISYATDASGEPLRANTLKFYYPENYRHTLAHEIGHMMGFPDQYWYGVVAKGSIAINTGQPILACMSFPIDDDSIMGQNMRIAKNNHIAAQWFLDWINEKIDRMGLIDG